MKINKRIDELERKVKSNDRTTDDCLTELDERLQRLEGSDLLNCLKEYERLKSLEKNAGIPKDTCTTGIILCLLLGVSIAACQKLVSLRHR